MDLGLRGKVALVCGGSSGLGFGCARIIAEEGARVGIVARSRDRLEEAARTLSQPDGPVVKWFSADLDHREDRRRLIEEVEEQLGGIDILVTNNGGPPPGGIDEVTDDDFDLAVERNLLSAIHLSRLVLPGMRQRRWGRIIHVASISVMQPVPGLLLSNTVRVGLAGFTTSASKEVARDGVCMHVVCPGSHDTDRIRELAAARAKRSEKTVDEEMQAIVAGIPVGRLGRTDELGALVAFLASEQAGFMTGTVIQADGGAYLGVL